MNWAIERSWLIFSSSSDLQSNEQLTKTMRNSVANSRFEAGSFDSRFKFIELFIRSVSRCCDSELVLRRDWMGTSEEAKVAARPAYGDRQFKQLHD